ncbi:MAG: hydroxymethylbilane synthase [Anaerolineae bacterium]|nr:hydroxymethylbilane synthase [Anaerolineae bacterium]
MTTPNLIRIGTRRSQLALWQTFRVRDLLLANYPDLTIELVHMTTKGDRILDKPLPEIGGKGLFTLELENALVSGEIDLAVHSLKDLPTEMAEPFTLGAILPRANPFDALVSREKYTLATLPHGATVGTSSLRRRAQLRAFRPDLKLENLRGNVDTRVAKAYDPAGPYAAIVLAVAGLQRLDRGDEISEIIDADVMLPAPGQGAVAVQCRVDDQRILELLAALDDRATHSAVTAERAFLQQLEAGCRLPVSAYATLDDATGRVITMTGRVSGLDGTRAITVQGEDRVTNAAALGVRLAEDALAQGADALLAEIRGDLPA